MNRSSTIGFAFIVLFGATLIDLCLAQSEITIPELREHIAFLASDSLKGRKAGTEACKTAAKYIKHDLSQDGLELLKDDGFQFLEIVTAVEVGDSNSLSFRNFEGTCGENFTPLSFSANSTLSTTVSFVGYGFNISEDSLEWHDYDSLDVSGRWVMILRGDPDNDKPKSDFEAYSPLRQKVLLAKDRGAAGVLFVSGVQFDESDDLIEMRNEPNVASSGIPVIHIKREMADKMLLGSGKAIVELERELNETRHPLSFSTTITVTATTHVLKKKATTQNVIAMLPGSDPVLKNEFVIIGAHYDHLGYGGPGSGSRRPDTLAIHNGADDNASGVAGVLEIAEKLAAHKQSLKRSVLIMAFAAEEMGSLGAKYFTDHPSVDLKQIKFMFNLDMIGRLDTTAKALTLGGTGTAVGLEDVVKYVAKKHKIKTNLSSAGYGPSDHAIFYAADIPVLFFFTGAHEDYHTPNDDTERINFAGLKTVVDFAYDLVLEIADRSEAMVYQEAGPKSRPSGRRRFKVTLGLMPDHAATDIEGMRVDLVIKDRPAYLAGMKKGDIITAMDGRPVSNIYDYMYRLNEFKPGQRITVDVMRDGHKQVLLVDL